MFEDSLVESTGRIRTRRGGLAVGSFLLQAAILAVFILIPYLYPAALPRQTLAMLLTAPPPPPAPANLPQSARLVHAVPVATLVLLHMPSRIPPHAAVNAAASSAPTMMGAGLENTGPATPGALQNLFEASGAPTPRVVVEAKPKAGLLRISAGVSEGRLLAPIHPVYPTIAKSARIEGTVVVEAVISKTGAVENARAVSGPPMLIQAAISAIAQARYQPYNLNGEPVEVETTINIIFRLNQ
jgi:periplasmic protein TonB